MFRGKCENVTLVFDKGTNSTENFKELDDSPYHFIGSLVPSQHQDLLDIPLQKFHALDDPAFAGVRAYRTEKEVFGRKRTIVITRSRALLRGQIRGIRQHLTKKMRALRDLQKRIVRSHEPGWRGKPYTVTNIQKNLDTIISGQYIQGFLWGQVTRKRQRLGIAFGTDEEAYRKLKERVLGKRILFTDRTDLTDEQIIFGYRGQHHIERAFREMKDPYCIRFSPPRHWTDHMLRVHHAGLPAAPPREPSGSRNYAVPSDGATQRDQGNHELLSRAKRRKASSGRPAPLRVHPDAPGSSTRTDFSHSSVGPFPGRLV